MWDQVRILLRKRNINFVIVRALPEDIFYFLPVLKWLDLRLLPIFLPHNPVVCPEIISSSVCRVLSELLSVWRWAELSLSPLTSSWPPGRLAGQQPPDWAARQFGRSEPPGGSHSQRQHPGQPPRLRPLLHCAGHPRLAGSVSHSPSPLRAQLSIISSPEPERGGRGDEEHSSSWQTPQAAGPTLVPAKTTPQVRAERKRWV